MILVMDREDGDVRLITSLLVKTGFDVIVSADGAEVLDLCRRADPPARLVILDTETPGVQTSELLKEVQVADPRIRILLLSHKEAEPVRDWRVAGNVRGLVSRPFRRAQFLGSVLEVARDPLVRTA